MNLDDMACVGMVNDFMLSNTITRNKHLIPGAVIAAIIEGTVKFCDRMHDLGIEIHNAGGETAVVGDIVRTVDVGFTAFGRMRQDKLIVNDIQEGDVIVGFGSFGRATYEDEYNSGMGSNGLTSARHDVLHKDYADKYPESYSGETPREFVYSGSRRLDEMIDVGGSSMPLGKLILSPTRTFVPSMRGMFEELGQERLHGIIHCTGGGQTKVSHFLSDGLCAVKDDLFATPVLFDIIQKESGADWQEMFQVFNMGVRLEVYVDAADADAVVQHAMRYNIPAQVIGSVVADDSAMVRLKTSYGEFSY
jgi:phosphoribosylformylglycinamidine cyclo-ligase